jgi:hypothetical protein
VTIYRDLNVVDDFEEQHGFDEALTRARAFMIAYMELMHGALPGPARRGLDVAKRWSEGALRMADVESARYELWKYIMERHAVVDYQTPAHAIAHAAFGPLTDRNDLKPGETISERVSNFLECANRFEDQSVAGSLLLKSMFG